MSERSAASFIRAAAAGLYHLHQHHIIHNDMKPENLLLTDTDPPTLKLAGEHCDGRHTVPPSRYGTVPPSHDRTSPPHGPEFPPPRGFLRLASGSVALTLRSTKTHDDEPNRVSCDLPLTNRQTSARRGRTVSPSRRASSSQCAARWPTRRRRQCSTGQWVHPSVSTQKGLNGGSDTTIPANPLTHSLEHPATRPPTHKMCGVWAAWRMCYSAAVTPSTLNAI